MPGVVKPRRKNLHGASQIRIIASRFPPIAIFENLVAPGELEILYALEAMTNDRIQAEVGNLYLLDRQDWVTGQGASVVMAAFTHIGRESRFGNGGYGVYYAGLDENTAIAETVFHQERRLRETNEEAIEIDMRCYRGSVVQPLDDIRGKAFESLRDPSLKTWPVCQRFAEDKRAAKSFGLLYKSARCTDGVCVAAFKPSAISKPRQGKHLRYCWNGEKIDRVLSINQITMIN